jgi:peptidyl-tRNA hydrolase, PTH1 family
MASRKIVVGLGNPGERFKNTPHNLGYEVVDLMAAEVGAAWLRREPKSLTAHSRIEETELFLLKPQTFMNLSGISVVRSMEQYGVEIQDLIVISDDLSLPFGKIRIRGRGSAGGHKGLESIIASLGGNNFVRVRLGIGLEKDIEDPAEYVLRPLATEMRMLANEMIIRGKEAAKAVCVRGLRAAMNQFN